ncbi:MAG: glycoside hydrolase family 88 protein [Prevotella sp.]|nr:glycoside hydrolase family 88 protein [Prevotella sp.]
MTCSASHHHRETLSHLLRAIILLALWLHYVNNYARKNFFCARESFFWRRNFFLSGNKKKKLSPFAFLSFFRNSAIKDGEVTPSWQKKKQVSLFCARLFVTLHPMRKICVMMVLAAMAMTASAQAYSHYSEWLVASEMQRVAHPYNLDFSPSKARWSYTMGIELESMLDTWLRYGDDRILSYIGEYPEKMISQKGAITGYKYSDFNLDNVRTGRFILRWYQRWPERKDSIAIDEMFRQLENQPRTNEGVWWHKDIYAWQVWLDGIYMGLPFYTMAAPWLRAGKERQYYDDAVDQIVKTDQRTYDEATRLWKHAWDERHTMFWANKDTGLSQHTWGRALGWFAMALVEVLDALPQDYERRAEVTAIFEKVMRSVVEYQQKDSGVWYDVLDVDDARNYLEATCSSMFAYCLLKGSRLGYLDDSYRQAGLKAYRGIVKEFVKRNADGTISLSKCCSVSGLGPDSNPKRDGSFEYYMSEPVRDNDAKGVGPFVWASLEMELMGYDVNNLEQDLTGVAPVRAGGATTPATSPAMYDLQGRRVGAGYRGVVISGGRKAKVNR